MKDCTNSYLHWKTCRAVARGAALRTRAMVRPRRRPPNPSSLCDRNTVPGSSEGMKCFFFSDVLQFFGYGVHILKSSMIQKWSQIQGASQKRNDCRRLLYNFVNLGKYKWPLLSIYVLVVIVHSFRNTISRLQMIYVLFDIIQESISRSETEFGQHSRSTLEVHRNN